jgi:hypothetical protein
MKNRILHNLSDCYSPNYVTVFSKEYDPLVVIADSTGPQALLGKTRVSPKESGIVDHGAI